MSSGYAAVLSAIYEEVLRQDDVHPQGFRGETRDNVRLGIAALQDECQEAYSEWMINKRTENWNSTADEVIQVAAVAVRLISSISDLPGRQCDLLEIGSWPLCDRRHDI